MSNLRCGLVAVSVLATLAGCASRGSGWPSLMTAEEQRTGKPATASAKPDSVSATQTPVGAAAAAAPAPAPVPAPTPPPAQDSATTALIRVQTSRLTEAGRDAAYIRERFGKQRDILSDTIGNVTAKNPTDSQWNAAQMELTRLNQIIAEWDDLETTVNVVAGQLAVGAHLGGNVAEPLTEAGALLAQITQAKGEASAIRDTMRRTISP